MNTKDIIKKLENIKKNMPDLIIKKIKVSLFNYVYIISNESVSSSDRVNNFILKYFSNKSLVNNKILTSLKKEIEEDVYTIQDLDNYYCNLRL